MQTMTRYIPQPNYAEHEYTEVEIAEVEAIPATTVVNIGHETRYAIPCSLEAEGSLAAIEACIPAHIREWLEWSFDDLEEVFDEQAPLTEGDRT